MIDGVESVEGSLDGATQVSDFLLQSGHSVAVPGVRSGRADAEEGGRFLAGVTRYPDPFSGSYRSIPLPLENAFAHHAATRAVVRRRICRRFIDTARRGDAGKTD